MYFVSVFFVSVFLRSVPVLSIFSALQVNSAATHIVSFTDNFRKAGNAQILEKAFSGAGLKRVRLPQHLNTKIEQEEIRRRNNTQ